MYTGEGIGLKTSHYALFLCIDVITFGKGEEGALVTASAAVM